MFEVEITAFEDAGARWEIEVERIGSFQFEPGEPTLLELVSEWVGGSLRLSASALIVMSRFEPPTELAVALAGADETNAFEYADRRHILVVATGDDRAHSWLPKRPIDEDPGCFGCVPATTPIGDDAVADLDGAVLSRRPDKADIADHRLRLPLDDHPHAEAFFAVSDCSLQRQYV